MALEINYFIFIILLKKNYSNTTVKIDNFSTYLETHFFSCVLFQSVWNLMACVKVLVEVYTTCGCNTMFPCTVDIMDGFGIVENTAFNNVYTCIAPQTTKDFGTQILSDILVDCGGSQSTQILTNCAKIQKNGLHPHQ